VKYGRWDVKTLTQSINQSINREEWTCGFSDKRAGKDIDEHANRNTSHSYWGRSIYTIGYDTEELRALKSRRHGQLNLAHGTET